MSRKLYYEDPYLTKCVTSVKEVSHEGVIFYETVAFPEGGGQIGDCGILRNLLTGEKVKFTDCQKTGGQKSPIEEFSNILVNSDVVHHVSPEDLSKFKAEEQWIVEIDGERRAKIMANHTGTHLLYLAVDHVRGGGYKKKQAGARITDEYGRMDFTTTQKFSEQEILAVEEFINGMIDEKLEIATYAHPQENEGLFWECNGEIVPCGGTHIENTGLLRSVSLKRKSIGKEADRLIANFEHSDELFEKFKP